MATTTLMQWDTESLTEYHSEEIADTIRCQMFGELVRQATPILEHYHSDLYRDSQWIARNLGRYETTFYYAADEWGTVIGQDRDLVFLYRDKLQLKVTILRTDSKWTATIQGMKEV